MGLQVRLGVLVAVLVSVMLPLALGRPGATAWAPVAATASALPPVSVVQVPARAGAPCSAGLVALTFDDGPARGVTVQLVQVLERLRVPATFFMVGSRVRTAPYAARVVARAGFAVGNHTWSHPHLTWLDDSAVRSEMRRAAAILRQVGVPRTRLMRPPYGAIDPRVGADIHGLGLVPVLWDVDSGDWRGGSASQIASSILGHLRPHESNIVLQHDGVQNSPASVTAVPRVVHAARQRGYCFTSLGPDGRMAPVAAAAATTVPARATPRLRTSSSHDVSLMAVAPGRGSGA